MKGTTIMNRLRNKNKNGDTTTTTPTQGRTDSDTVNIIVDLIGSTSYTTTDVSATLSPQPPPTSSFSVTDAVHHRSNDMDVDDDDDDDDDEEEHHEIMFEPAVAPTTDPKYYLPHNTTASTTFDNEDDSFYYAEEASLYSIAENSREDTIDNHTPIPPLDTIPVTAAVNATDSHGSHSSSTDYRNNNNSNNNRSSSNSNSQGNTNSSHTTPPINNVTSFEQKKEVGVELSYAGQRYRTTHNGKNEDEDVITKASDETLRTYYYQRTKTSKCGRSCGQYRWYHPKCRMLILLLIILLIGVIFLAASLTIYQSRTKQQQKSVASIEGSGKDPNTTTPTVAPTLLRSNNNNGSNGSKPTKMPMSSDELKYIVSESHVYNSIKNCQGTSTFFDTSTIQGQVFAQLVQEVSDQVVTTTTVTESDTPTYEFASHHTVSYLREKYSLNVLYLSTNGATTWKDTTNWMTMTNPCSGSSDTKWYGVQCSTSTTTETITTTAAAVSASTSTTASSPTCDASQPHIVSIDVSNNQLSGILPNELCCLPCVERMNLSNNSISGDFLWCINEIPTLADFNINFNPLLTTPP